MKRLIAVFLLFVSTSIFASGKLTDNTDWQYAGTILTWPDSKNVSAEPDGYSLSLTSDMRGSDVSLEYILTMYRNDVGAPPEASGWSLLIKFNGELKPIDIENMSVGYTLGGRWHRQNKWQTSGSDVVLIMSIDEIVALHDGVELDGIAEIKIWYKPKAENVEEVTLMFNFKNAFDTKFHELISDLGSLNAMPWLYGTAYYRDQPINRLPAGKKPTPSKMIEAAQRANIDIDMAYTLSFNQLVKLARDIATEKQLEARKIREAEQAERNRLAELERQRVAAEKKAAKQAQAAKMVAHAKILRNFDWPNSYCDRPSFPRRGINASQSARDRFNREHKEWRDCLNNDYDRDTRAIRDVVRAIDGDWSVAGGSIKYSANKQFMPRISELFEYRTQRASRRSDQKATLGAAIDDFNSRDASQNQKDEFWDGINESLDNMSRDMDRMNKQRQDMWNNQIYITPGFY